MTFPFLAGEIPPAEKLGEGPTTYSPSLTATTNPNLGADGSITGWWSRTGPNLITGGVIYIFSGTGLNVGSGNHEISLPLPADISLLSATTTAGQASIIGGGFLRRNDSTSSSGFVQTHLLTATVVRLRFAPGVNGVSSTVPASGWVVEGSSVSFNFTYPIEAGV